MKIKQLFDIQIFENRLKISLYEAYEHFLNLCVSNSGEYRLIIIMILVVGLVIGVVYAVRLLERANA